MINYFKNICPSCKSAKIFPGLYKMHEKCPHCGNVFEKESGYFIGAMIASYFLGTFLALPTLLLGIFIWNLEMPLAIGLSSAQLLLLQPLLFRYSRILWINIEAELTRSIHQNQPK